MIKRDGRIYSVYKHTNAENGKIYIGLTCQAPKRRWQNGAGYAKTYFGKAIQKYGWNAFQHDIIAKGLTKDEACELEISLIAFYQSNDRRFGYNLSMGGETTDCINVKSGAENNKAIAVTRINPKTGERTKFETIAEAARSMNINHRGISKACRGVAKTYKGFVWEYCEVDFDKPIKPSRGKYNHTKQMKRIKVINKDGSESTFESIKAASKFLNVAPCNISRYLSGLRRDPQERVWCFV